LAKFHIFSLDEVHITHSWSSNNNKGKITLLEFKIDKNFYFLKEKLVAETQFYHTKLTGALFHFERPFKNIEIYDTDSAVPFGSGNRVKMEALEFNKQLNVYAENPNEAFQLLHPDTMHQLLLLKERYNYDINLQIIENAILLFTDNFHFENQADYRPLFLEAMNQSPRPESMKFYEKKLTNLLQFYSEILMILKR
jgi:hypothetical protein